MSKINVLIAEDDYFSLLLIKEFLSCYDINIYSVKNGEDSIAYCKKYKIDILITDILMPELDGIISMKEIRKIYSEIKIIAETAYATREKLEEIKKAGFDAIIVKPYKKEDFQKIFNDVLKTIIPDDFA